MKKGAAESSFFSGKIKNTDLKNPWLSLVGLFVEVRRASSLWVSSRTDGGLLPLLFDVVRHYLASCFPCSAHISYQADLSHACRDHKWLNFGRLTFKVALLPPPDESPPSASHITSLQSHTDVFVVVDNERMH